MSEKTTGMPCGTHPARAAVTVRSLAEAGLRGPCWWTNHPRQLPCRLRVIAATSSATGGKVNFELSPRRIDRLAADHVAKTRKSDG